MKQAVIFVVLAIVVIVGGIYYVHYLEKASPAPQVTDQNQSQDKSQNTDHQTPEQKPPMNTPTIYNSEATLTAAAASAPITDSTLGDGLQIQEMQAGSGPGAKSGDTVTVNYIGTLANGTKFDASFNHGSTGFPFDLGVGQVIKGWDEGVAGMQVGGVRKLVIPPALGYGPNANGAIPANSTLYFTVQMLKIGS